MPIYIDEVANVLGLGMSEQSMSIAGAHLRRLYRARYGTEPMRYYRGVVALYLSNDMDLVVAALGDTVCCNERNVRDDVNNIINAR